MVPGGSWSTGTCFEFCSKLLGVLCHRVPPEALGIQPPSRRTGMKQAICKNVARSSSLLHLRSHQLLVSSPKGFFTLPKRLKRFPPRPATVQSTPIP